MAPKLRAGGRRRHRPAGRSRSAHGLMTRAVRLASFPLISPRRADLLLALALAVPSVAQVLLADRAAPVGVAIALVSTLPIALRRSHPRGAAVIGTLPWCVPTDGYVVVGFVAAFVLFYSAAAYTASLWTTRCRWP